MQREERENGGERHKRSEKDRTHSDNPGVKKRWSGGEEVEMVLRRWTAQWIILQRGLWQHSYATKIQKETFDDPNLPVTCSYPPTTETW